jgi:hypothetical protein
VESAALPSTSPERKCVESIPSSLSASGALAVGANLDDVIVPSAITGIA